MSTSSRTMAAFKAATSASFGALGVALPVVLIPAAITALGVLELSSEMSQAQFRAGLGQAGMMAGEIEQKALIAAALKETGLDVVLEIFFGPLIAASAIYTMATQRDERVPSLYGAINFSLARYGRLFKWHAAAWLSIKLGMLIVVPGVLFMMMYAMVDPVLCFEKEKWPLDRSKRLTRAWRRTIFLFILPWFFVTAAIPLLLLLWAPAQGGFVTFLVALGYYVFIFWLHAGFGHLYLERLEAGKRAKEAAEESARAAEEAIRSSVQDSPATDVAPMGLGQKLGLGLLGLAILGMVVSSFAEDEVPSSPSGTSPVVEDTEEAPVDEIESTAHLAQPRLPMIPLTLGEHTVMAEVAADNESRGMGLMHRESLGEDEGMLFVFPDSQVRGFWMQNTRIPLSIAYIDWTGRIVSISDMEPLSEESVSSVRPAQFALEMDQGWFAEHGVRVGQRIEGLPGLVETVELNAVPSSEERDVGEDRESVSDDSVVEPANGE